MREIIIPFATGITLFLFGMQLMRIGLMRISGDFLHSFLYRFTKTPYHGFFTGTVATLLLQSSSAVTVITIGLINAHLITFYQSIGIILGTNIGTVATAELIALNIGKWAVLLLLFGAILVLFPSKNSRAIGLISGGFAIIFLGMDALQMIATPIQNSKIMQSVLAMEEHKLFIGLLFGIVITAIIQSSSATTAITMSMIYYQNIPLTFGIAVILGSNIGTCFTAILASIGGSIEGKQMATAHLLLNIIGVIIFYPLIIPLALIVQSLAEYPPTQIAHAQLIFNLVNSLIILPFVKPFAKLTILLAPKENFNIHKFWRK
ncbi:hypothetical protein BHF71_04250 [Vulcanibacillus modesticaldus]|uniref:Na/Pi cotransporter n=1 Tax=Vulcanibacillus modesticaldus TaxID=337097 RepID=A0A1D2YSG0_9BACI|nr:Na/Pi symporter [Vulcanibacillus modesticaldus]OEF96947.1 hypothetical protein BHF71_04250 [Vulcanibacillus modesticaldus]